MTAPATPSFDSADGQPTRAKRWILSSLPIFVATLILFGGTTDRLFVSENRDLDPIRKIEPPQGVADSLPDAPQWPRARDQVAGFQSHRFTKFPESPVTKAQPHGQWQIVRLELVSLLKHETPVAYVSNHLPLMDELQDAPTRPLDPFEHRALDLLRLDEDILIEDTTNRIRMVGSLRASKNCLDCHSVRRGELLGALTYELVPVRLPRKRVDATIPLVGDRK